MLEVLQGDIFSSGCQALVCPVNTVGVMGKGLALAFKERYPAYFKAYQELCRRKQIHLGNIVPFVLPQPEGSTKVIISFATKSHWTEKSQDWVIKFSLTDLSRLITQQGYESVAVPAVGCGEGGLAWKEIRPMIEAALGHFKWQTIKVYEPLYMAYRAMPD
jgi:O-acetyl-ADP-ribose deacetylase (regulator of RNase III)